MISRLRFGELAALRPIDVDTRSLVVRVTRQLVEPERAAPYIDLPKGSKTRQSVFAG
jgi:integrase